MRNLKWQMARLSHHVTWFLGTSFPKSVPLIFVIAYPKSGTTWVCHLVGDYLRRPFPTGGVLLPVAFPAVVHGHERVWKSYRQGVYVLRDGRDAEISKFIFYSHSIPEGDHPPMTRQQRRRYPGLFNKANIREHLADFLEGQRTRPIASRANWGEHVRSFFNVKNPNVVLLGYEQLIHDGPEALATAMGQLTGEPPDLERAAEALRRCSFRNQKQLAGAQGRSPKHFFGSGTTGRWKKYFNRRAAELFDRYWGNELIQAGYETDHEWVRQCDD